MAQCQKKPKPVEMVFSKLTLWHPGGFGDFQKKNA